MLKNKEVRPIGIWNCQSAQKTQNRGSKHFPQNMSTVSCLRTIFITTYFTLFIPFLHVLGVGMDKEKVNLSKYAKIQKS